MQSTLAALALHVFLKTYDVPPQPKPLENTSKQEVIAIFEEEEKKRQTKADVKISARL